MKRILFALLALPMLVTSCFDDDDSNVIDYSKYYEWRDRNNAIFDTMESYLATHGESAYFSDTIQSLSYPAFKTFYRVIASANEDSLRAIKKWYTPFSTSTLKVHYTLYDTESVLDLMPGDAALFNDPAVMDSIFFDSSIKADTLESMQVQYYENFTCNDVIDGWGDILQNMHIGDEWLVAIPWQLGYGQSGQSSGGIMPYSSLFFRVKLCDILWWGGTVEAQ